MNTITFEQRKANILTVDDISHQIMLARKYMKRLHTKASRFTGSIDVKRAMDAQAMEAEVVYCELSLNSKIIENELRTA